MSFYSKTRLRKGGSLERAAAPLKPCTGSLEEAMLLGEVEPQSRQREHRTSNIEVKNGGKMER